MMLYGVCSSQWLNRHHCNYNGCTVTCLGNLQYWVLSGLPVEEESASVDEVLHSGEMSYLSRRNLPL